MGAIAVPAQTADDVIRRLTYFSKKKKKNISTQNTVYNTQQFGEKPCSKELA